MTRIRRPSIFILSLFMLFFIASSLDAAMKGIHVVSKKGKELYLYRDYHALVVGVGDYDYWPDLQGAVNDARLIAEALRKLDMKVTLLVNPTSAELKRALNTITYDTGTLPNRAILFYFSGHGETETLATGEKLGYIVPRDAPLPSKDRVGFNDKALSMTRIEQHALQIKSKHVLMVFDSCFSGSVFASLKGAPTDISEKSNRPVRQFITAGNENEQVPDVSVFKTCFIQGINGEADANADGYVTGSELGLYLDSSVVNYSRGCQHPQYGMIRHPKLDKGDFIIRLASAGAVVDAPSAAADKATLSVKSNIAGARVFVDGRDRGATPLSGVALSPGSHRIKVNKEGFQPYERAVVITEGRSLSLTAYLDALKPAVGSLSVDTNPGDATVRILNITPPYYRGMELEPGRYHIEVSASGHETKTQWIDLAAGEDRYLDIRLEKKDDTTFTNSLGMTFVLIPAGSFMMGSTLSAAEVVKRYGGKEEWFKDEHPRHRVTLTQPFCLQTTEVTVGQWRSFIRDTGYRTEAETGGGAYIWTGEKWEKKAGTYWDNPGFSQTDAHPVTCVSWNDVKRFITWLNEKEGKDRYRLPTEAEWEYACRGGMETIRYWGDDPDRACGYANVADKAAKKEYPGWTVHDCDDGYVHTAPVACYKPNNFGLHDMLGNVWEWCGDWYGDYPRNPSVDPTGPSSGTYRVLRGGSWDSSARSLRAAGRNGFNPDCGNHNLGFRVVRAR